MTDSSGHKSTTREAFTEQASDYADSPLLADPEKVERLVQATGASAESRVLEVATGPGHVAFGFAEVCEEVVGVDLTRAPLGIATETKRDQHVDTAQFLQADAEDLPFDDECFDIVVCRLAFHHLESPSDVLREMARVCRLGGTIVVDDITVSEFPERASYQNRFERLRDPSHVRALPRSELLALFTEHGIEVTSVASGTIVQEVEQWLSLAQTPEARADMVRELIEEDAEKDLSGTRPFRRNNDLYFTQQTTTVVGRRLDS